MFKHTQMVKNIVKTRNTLKQEDAIDQKQNKIRKFKC